jgi:hypothetical protein
VFSWQTTPDPSPSGDLSMSDKKRRSNKKSASGFQEKPSADLTRSQVVQLLAQTPIVGSPGTIGRLAGVNFSGLDLSGLKFTGLDLSRAIFRGCILNETWFDDADLTGADFSGAKSQTAMFGEAKMILTKFRDSEMCDVDFTGCRMEEADFTGAQIRGCRFDNAMLHWATIGDCINCRFDGADILLCAWSKAEGCSFQEIIVYPDRELDRDVSLIGSPLPLGIEWTPAKATTNADANQETK